MLHFNQADLRAVSCRSCGKTIAETDGASLIVKRDGSISQFFTLRAVLQCHRTYIANGRTRVCGVLNTIEIDVVHEGAESLVPVAV